MDMRNAQGYALRPATYVGEIVTGRFGRSLTVRETIGMGELVYRAELTPGQKVVPLIEAQGFKMTGKWSSLRPGLARVPMERA